MHLGSSGVLPMLSLRRPSAGAIRDFLAAQSQLDFSYSEVGSTATVAPAGYALNHTRVKLGQGETIFGRAKAALERWDHFRLGWVEAWSPASLIAPGEVVAVLARKFGVWSLNACRIVYVVDDPAPIPRFGFAYGTLPDHVETGEERFVVEYDQSGTGEVWYDILAFSRPHHPLVRLANPYMRRIQRRFGQESAAAMARTVSECGQ
jgi:uncharacterized protein (UPF0548 family)